MNPEEFKVQLASMGIELSDHQMQQFNTYYQMLIETNEHVNLTTITDESAVYLKHFYDSITPAFYDLSLQNDHLSLCDVGAGAGFPSLPMKIIFPNLKVTIVDSLNKRITFLQNLVDALGLDGVELYHARAEEFGGKKSKHREKYDVATARAVARMSVLSELCLPLVKVGGKMIALKAAQAETELENGNQAIKTLGGQVVADEEFSLPVSDDKRHIIILNKIKKTPKQYPRKAGTPNKKPIGESAK